MGRRRLLAPFIAATLLLGFAVTPAAALTHVGVPTCANNGGELHITPDFVYLEAAWGTKTKGQIQAFLKSITWKVTVDGTPVNVTPFITDPWQTPDGWWVTFMLPAGQLELNETMSASVEYVLSKPVYDGFEHIPAGSVSTFECTIIADLT